MTLTAVINPVVPLNLLFYLKRVICPQSRQSAKYRIVTHNFTNDDLTNGESPSYQADKDKGYGGSAGGGGGSGRAIANRRNNLTSFMMHGMMVAIGAHLATVKAVSNRGRGRGRGPGHPPRRLGRPSQGFW